MSTETVTKPKTTTKPNGLKQFNYVTINLPLATRPSTRPGVTGMESYPTHAEVVKIGRNCKVNDKNAELDNKHRIGLAIVEPGTPNHLMILLPKDSCKAGDRIDVTMTWEPIYQGSNVTGYDRTVKFNVQ